MKKARFVLRIIAGVVLGVFLVALALNSLWVGFLLISYCALLVFLPIVFTLLFIRYKFSKKNIEDNFAMFVLEEYNNGNISKEEKEQPTKFLHDEYIKANRKVLGMIIVLMILVIAVFLSTIIYGINSLKML